MDQWKSIWVRLTRTGVVIIIAIALLWLPIREAIAAPNECLNTLKVKEVIRLDLFAWARDDDSVPIDEKLANSLDVVWVLIPLSKQAKTVEEAKKPSEIIDYLECKAKEILARPVP